MTERGQPFPAFCGGAGAETDTATASEPDELPAQRAEERRGVQAPLDYATRNLQCRSGNARKEIRLWAWAWAGSVLEGPRLWNRRASAVMAALSDDDVVRIAHLLTLQKLRQRFDYNVQDGDAHFLSEMVDMAEPRNNVVTHYSLMWISGSRCTRGKPSRRNAHFNTMQGLAQGNKKFAARWGNWPSPLICSTWCARGAAKVVAAFVQGLAASTCWDEVDHLLGLVTQHTALAGGRQSLLPEVQGARCAEWTSQADN